MRLTLTFLSTLAVLLSGCSAIFPLVGDTSEDLTNLEFMDQIRTKEDVLNAFGEPHSISGPQDSADFAVWLYAADPALTVLGNTPYRPRVIRSIQRNGDPRYDLPSLEDFPGELVAQGEMIVQLRGDSVSGWCTHNMDFSQRDQFDRLARRGFVVDAALMTIGVVVSLFE